MTRQPSGIYKITNNANGKVYIGQSQNIFMRRRQHFMELSSGRHPNKNMQNDWNKNNKYFRWDVLEYCSISELNDREKYWIDKYNALEKGYNIDWVPYKRKIKKITNRKKIGYRKRS